MKENLHAGHRERMISKFLKAPDMFSEHELLEILLFYALPRIDTNALAHRILNVFGSLEHVFNASPEHLKKIDGLGDRTIAQIIVLGQIIKQIEKAKKKDNKIFKSPESIREELRSSFSDNSYEKFVMVLLDKRYRMINKISFTDENRSQVKADIPEIANAFEIYKPTFAVMAHNHPSYNAYPSKEDDYTTKKINVICEIYDVVLSDHMIFAGQDVFSYRMDGRLDEFKQTTALKKIFEHIKEN